MKTVPPIIIRHLQKSYKTVHAVDDVSLEVNQGEVFGLIGPDGAGKTTLIRMLVTLLNADAGQVLFMGREVNHHADFVRSHIGYMPQRFSLYRDLSVSQNLRFFGDLFGLPNDIQTKRTEALYQFSKLGPFRDRRAGNLSGGMKQKLALSCMLMHEPDVIVLDEPTFGVDPVSRNEFWEILNTLAARGISILITTPYMDEANLCSRVGLIHKGRLLASDTPQTLLRQFTHPVYQIRTRDTNGVYKVLKSTVFGKRIQLFGDGVHVIDKDRIGIKTLTAELRRSGIAHEAIQEIRPNLENLFLELMQ